VSSINLRGATISDESVLFDLEDIFFTQGEIEEALIDDVLERMAWAASLPSWLGRVRRSFADMWR